MTALRSQAIVLYAVNTGSLYQLHLALARKRAPTTEWWLHVRNQVLPLYRREIEPAVAAPSEIIHAAADLKDYYERHLREDKPC